MGESGYWNGWSSFEEWASREDYTKTCKHCELKFFPKSGNQKFCHEGWCMNDRYYEKLWNTGKHPLQK